MTAHEQAVAYVRSRRIPGPAAFVAVEAWQAGYDAKGRDDVAKTIEDEACALCGRKS